RVKGHRLAFAQGGHRGFRLVYLTPPVRVQAWSNRCEALWDPISMPFKYEDAPLLASNDDGTDFPSLSRLFTSTQRTTVEGGFASLFRSRIRPLNLLLSQEVIRIYDQKRAQAGNVAIAATYEEALPYEPPVVDRRRRDSYEGRLTELRREKSGGCSQTK